VLCEAAYRTHFSASELQSHLAALGTLLSKADVIDISVHTSCDQRCVGGAGGGGGG